MLDFKKKGILLGLSAALLIAGCGSDVQTADSSMPAQADATRDQAGATPQQADATPDQAHATPVQADAAQSQAAGAVDQVALDVYKSETCGCCQDWIDHMQDQDFGVTTHHPVDLAAEKQKLGVDPRYQSCHTAVSADGYIFEGHIPAKVVNSFLAEKPHGAIGLAVPGMPVGSPGMEVGNRFMPYDVLLLKDDGSTEVYASIETAQAQY